MKNKEFYDLLVKTSLEGGFPSIRPLDLNEPLSIDNFTCCYRSPNGKKCAIGLGIKDEDYSPEMDRDQLMTVTKLLEDYPNDIFNFIKYTRIYQLQNLQNVHDTLAKEYIETGVWNHQDFVNQLNTLSVFGEE